MKTIILTSKQLIFFKPPRPEGVNNKYDLWEGINGDEYFPKTTGSAFYILKLSKAVERSSEVDEADKLLKDAFKSLAQVWQFASGSRMSLENVVVNRVTDENLNSNAKEVKVTLLTNEGLKQVASIQSAALESCATYYHPPLKIAIDLCLLARGNADLKELFEYHYETHVDSNKWFNHLYKVGDVLKRIFGNDKKLKTALDIIDDDWRKF